MMLDRLQAHERSLPAAPVASRPGGRVKGAAEPAQKGLMGLVVLLIVLFSRNQMVVQ